MQIFVNIHHRSSLSSASGTALLAALVLAACGDSDETVDAADTGVDSGMDAGSDIAADGQGGPDADTGSTDVEPLAISGSWVDSFGGAHEISSEEWQIGSSTHIITQYDNEAGYVIAQNGSDNEFSPDLWSRFDFAWDSSNTLYYCQSAFGAADEAEALATPAADRGGFDTDGCGGFAWSQLVEPPTN